MQSGARVSGLVKFEGTPAPPTGVPDRNAHRFRSVLSSPDRPCRCRHRFASNPTVVSNTVGYVPGRVTANASIPPAAPGPGAVPSGRQMPKSAHREWLGRVRRRSRDRAEEFRPRDRLCRSDHRAQRVGPGWQGATGQDAEVVVFPADSTGWKQGVVNARRVRTMRPSTTGQFMLSGLPPGEDSIVALTSESVGETQDPKFRGSP